LSRNASFKVVRTTVIPSQVEELNISGIIEEDSNSSVIGSDERRSNNFSGEGGLKGGDLRARDNILTEGTSGEIISFISDVVVGGVDFDQTSTVGATVVLGSHILIKSNIPLHGDFTPVVDKTNEEVGHIPGQDSVEVVGVVTTAFSLVDLIIREFVVEDGLVSDITIVAMNSRTSNNLLGSFIEVGEDIFRVVNSVPVVIKDKDLSLDAKGNKSGSQIVVKEIRLGFSIHDKTRISGGAIHGFVLDSHSMEGDVVGSISLDNLDEIKGISSIVSLDQVTFNTVESSQQAFSVLHPSRGSPGGDHNLKIRVDFKDFLQHGDDIFFIMSNGEM